MGIVERAVSRQVSKGRTKGQAGSLGEWVDSALATYPMLTRREVFNLALFKALATVDPSGAESYFIFTNERRVQKLTASSRMRNAIVRADGSSAPRIACGAPGHGWLTTDWTVEIQSAPGGREATIAVPQHREVEGAVPNHRLLQAMRASLAAIVEGGPSGVELREGPPTLEETVEIMPAPRRFDSSGDHVQPIPSCFSDGVAISLPLTSANAVATAIHARHMYGDPGPGLAEISLGGGRAGKSSAIRLLADGKTVSLVMALADEGAIARQRTFRAAISALDRLALKLHEVDAEAEAGIVRYLAQCRAGRDSQDRVQRFNPVWDTQVPSGAIIFQPGLAIPVVTTVQSTLAPDRLQLAYLNAETWLLQRERSWSRGLRQQARDANRHYTMRGPAQVSDGQTLKASFRYGETNPAQLGKHGTITDKGLWFWEVAYRNLAKVGEPTEATLSVTSLSRCENVLYYGTELARYLSAFVWQVLSADPEARFRTVVVRV